MSTALSNFVNGALPVAASTGLTYNAQRNMYLTNGHTSSMGHTYFRGIQLSDRVAVIYDIGRGGYGCNPTFLNGVTVYCYDGTAKKIIGKWTPSPWAFYSDYLARKVAATLLYDYLKSQMKIQGVSISDSELEQFAVKQIEAAVTNAPNQIA